MVVKNTNIKNFDWIQDYPAAVTVCDTEGIIIAMNNRSAEQFKKRGGAGLIGTSLFDCHPESANSIIRRQLQTQQANVYITERKSGRRLIQQVPWYRDGVFAGIVETVSPIAGDIPVKQRK
jgi:transcriptional regulator with PAS, ATPase and Fis domain